MREFIISFIGDDQPGFISAISEIIANNNGSWLESRMSQLAGKFAGIVRISVSAEKLQALQAALRELANDQFSLLIENVDDPADTGDQQFLINVLGHDRAGIVSQVTSLLAAQGVNVLEMATDIAPAAMTGQKMFGCEAKVAVAGDIDMGLLEDQLAAAGDELGVDIELVPAE